MPDSPLERARDALAVAHRVVVLTGAGISTASGIPDFRGPEGLWTKDPHAEMLANFDTWVSRPDVRRAAWRSRVAPRTEPVPNAAHYALTTLERRGVLSLLVTQNVDGLHQLAGTSADRVVEIHGSSRDTVCLRCGHRQPMSLTLARVRAGDDDPACDQIVDGSLCGGILKSATISFGQSLVPEDLARANRAARAADYFVAVGTTLAVYPVADLLPTARAHGAFVVIVNGEPTRMDDLADVVLTGEITEVLPALLADEMS